MEERLQQRDQFLQKFDLGIPAYAYITFSTTEGAKKALDYFSKNNPKLVSNKVT